MLVWQTVSRSITLKGEAPDATTVPKLINFSLDSAKIGHSLSSKATKSQSLYEERSIAYVLLNIHRFHVAKMSLSWGFWRWKVCKHLYRTKLSVKHSKVLCAARRYERYRSGRAAQNNGVSAVNIKHTKFSLRITWFLFTFMDVFFLKNSCLFFYISRKSTFALPVAICLRMTWEMFRI